MNTKRFKQILELAQTNKNAGAHVANGMLPGMAAKLAGGNGFTQIVNPANAAQTTTVQVPIGKPIVPIHIPHGLAVEDVVTIVIDTRESIDPANAASVSTNKTKIVLFDEGQYYAKGTGFSGNPSNTVYIDSTEFNLYAPWVSEHCSHAYILEGINVEAIGSTMNGAPTAKMQLSEEIKVHRNNVKNKYMGSIKPRQYKDPKDVDQDQRLISLTTDDSRIDRQTAWIVEVYDGMLYTIDLHIAAKVQY